MKHVLVIITILLTTMVFSSASHAETVCKGKAKSACAANSSCSWVDGYKRKDGVKVSAYCRGGKNAAKAKAKNKKDGVVDKAKKKKAKKASDVKKKAAKKKSKAKDKAKAKKKIETKAQ